MTLSRSLAGNADLDLDLAQRVAQLSSALAIIEVWYTGMVGGQVITCEEAFMFRVVADTPVIRSCCPNKLDLWAQKPIEKQS